MSTPIIAMTTNNSINVNAARRGEKNMRMVTSPDSNLIGTQAPSHGFLKTRTGPHPQQYGASEYPLALDGTALVQILNHRRTWGQDLLGLSWIGKMGPKLGDNTFL